MVKYAPPPTPTPTRHLFIPLQTSSPQKPLGQSKPNFTWSLNGLGERKFVRRIPVTWPRWPPRPKKIKNIFFSWTKGSMALGLGMQHWGHGPNKFWKNYNLRLTLTFSWKDQMFLHRLLQAKLEKSSCLKPECLGLWYLICSFILWTSTKIVLKCITKWKKIIW